MASLHHTTFSSVVYRLCYSSHSSLIDIHSSYKHTPRPKGSHTGLPTTVEYYRGTRYLVFPPPVQARLRCKFYRYSCVEAKSLLVQKYSFIDIQIMTNDRNLQLVASFSIVKRRRRSTGRSPHSGSAMPPGSRFLYLQKFV